MTWILALRLIIFFKQNEIRLGGSRDFHSTMNHENDSFEWTNKQLYSCITSSYVILFDSHSWMYLFFHSLHCHYSLQHHHQQEINLQMVWKVMLNTIGNYEITAIWQSGLKMPLIFWRKGGCPNPKLKKLEIQPLELG